MRRGSIGQDLAQSAAAATVMPCGQVGSGARQDLVALIERATRRPVTLVCGPGGIGKTLACSLWAVGQLGSLVVWLTLSAEDDQSLFWARLYHGLQRAAAAPIEAVQTLAEATVPEFPLRLAEVARSLVMPVVIIIDNAHDATNTMVLSGLDVLIRIAPPNLRIVLAGRDRPQLRQLARLQASGDIAVIGPAELARMVAP